MSEELSSTEQWAIRALARIADALEEALGQDWAESGEGDLADGVRVLARQRDAARHTDRQHAQPPTGEPLAT